jgi:hypothetical protein
MYLLKKSLILLSFILYFPHLIFAQTHPTLENTVICGYQGWFACYGDGSPVERWNHWCSGRYRSDTPKPSPGYQTFEIYPNISEYPDSVLYQTGYDLLGDNRSAKLFSSYREETIDLHFKWMKEAGIDGIALQRFLGETRDAVYKAHRDSVAVRVKRAAEKYDRIFYIMYDGIGNSMDYLISDWQYLVNVLKITSSPRYAYMNQKPVVCFWGFGFTHYSDTAQDALRAINWFKSNGYYVIGGVPTNWRKGTGDSKPNYEQVYKAFDMISPWTVGRYKWDVEIDNYKNNYLISDKATLDSFNIAYQPVIFPGFAWSNWNGGERNAFPRRLGKFMWRQFYNIKSLGIKYVYVAMFDEYDEGTAIAKSAMDYFDIPKNQYFQTLSIDSVFVSSDFYLRLAGAASKVLKGQLQITQNVPIPLSIGPVFFRTSFEPSDAQLTWNSSIDSTIFLPKNVSGISGNGNPECYVAGEKALSGQKSIKYSGSVNVSQQAQVSFKLISINFSVANNMIFSYAFYPQNELASYAHLDLITKDGIALSSTDAVDTQQIKIKGENKRGKIGEWNIVKCKIGNWLLGKELEKINLTINTSNLTGQFIGYIDDIRIQTENITTIGKNKEISSNQIKDYNFTFYFTNRILKINKSNFNSNIPKRVYIYKLNGDKIYCEYINNNSLYIKLDKGIYIIKIKESTNKVFINRLIVLE